ncbi:MAG: hypothetical protein VX152_09360, partial [Pseudomonadota bacterium]|nr:hypothetical protein [Pseudomonadota bacterium]
DDISWAINAADAHHSVALYREAARTWAADIADERLIVFSDVLDGATTAGAQVLSLGAGVCRLQQHRF